MQKTEDKIPVKNFCICFKRQANEVLKAKYFRDNLKIKTTYIKIQEKRVLIKSIIYNDTNECLYSSIDRYINYALSVIDSYTNLKIKFENKYEEYDLLNENGLIDLILSEIPKRELNEFKILLEMELKDIVDIMQN